MKKSRWRVRAAIGMFVAVGFAWNAEAVKLRWDAPAVGIPEGYTMYRYTVPGANCGNPITPTFELLGIAPTGAAPTFTDNSPVVGANYYHVTAYNSGGESLPSNQICFQATQKTSAPQALRVE